MTLAPGPHSVTSGAEITFPAGATAPHAVGQARPRGRTWSRPFGPVSGERSHPLFFTYSLMLATFLGTMGLPHILVRFYTNPDGRAARQTTLIVLVLLGAFYIFPAVYGALGRLYAPDLYLTKGTDTVVLALPGRVFSGFGGELLSGLVAAGAFAAFLSTASGLLISVAGALAQDVFKGQVTDFRRGAALAGTVAIVFGLLVEALRHQPAGRLGLRHRRLQLLPAAGTRDLVAGPHRRRRRRRNRRRGRPRLGRHPRHHAGPPRPGLGRGAAGPAGRLVGARPPS